MSETVDARRQCFESEIRTWVSDRNSGKSVNTATPQEIGQLPGVDRALVLRSSLLPNMAHLLACNPNADCALGILIATTLLADNRDGCATISVGTLGKLLSRHPRNIMDARQRCVDAGVLRLDTRPGQSSRAWPIVSPFLIEDPQASLAWLLRVLAGERPAHGRPRREKPLHTGIRGFRENPCIPASKTPACRHAPDTTKRDTSKREPSQTADDQKVTLPQTWSLPADWRQWTRQTFVASDEAIARSAARFHTLKASRPRTAERRLQEWQAWCHGEHAFTLRTQGVAAPAAGISPAVIRGALRTHADGVSWGAFESQLGPAPGQPGCIIAPEYLAEHAQYVAERARRTTGRAA